LKNENVLGPRALIGLDVAGYGRSGLKKSWTVPSLPEKVGYQFCQVTVAQPE